MSETSPQNTASDAPAFISYARLLNNLRNHPLALMEIPTEDRISIPLPTRRFATYGAGYGSAYAFYAAPAFTPAGSPKTEGAPDYWGALAAQSGSFLLFAQCALLPFAAPELVQRWAGASASLAQNAGQTPQTASDALTRFTAQLETLAPVFFQGRAGGANLRRDALRLFQTAIPVAIHDRHRALAPDFFAWLEA